LEDNEKYRFDSEYFGKEFIGAYQFIYKHDYTYLANEIQLLTDYHANGSYELLNKYVKIKDKQDYAYMIRTTDLEKMNFENDVKYVSKTAYEFLSKTQLYGGELLINKIGNPGQVYIMPTLNKHITLGMNLFMFRLKEYTKLNNYYIYIFFNTYYGNKIIYRKINGAVPLTIDKEAIRSLPIPIFSNTFQLQIENLVKSSYQKLEDSKKLYKEAQNLLLKELDLVDYKPSKEKIAIKNLSESFGISGRLDSEYYQPKYDEILEKIKKVEYDKLDNIVKIDKSVEPGSEAYQDNGIPFIRVSNLTKFGLSKPEIHLSCNLFDSNTLEKLQPKKDTILLSKDGTVGIAYNIKEDTHIITSGAILHLKIKKSKKDNILPEYLTLVLNSLLVQMQSQRDAGGSIIKHWKPSEIKEVLIPIIDIDKQKEIEEKIIESFKLKNESQKFLDKAKEAVEIAIEQDENIAMEYIKNDKI